MGDAGDAGASVWEETVGGVPVTWRRTAAMSRAQVCPMGLSDVPQEEV